MSATHNQPPPSCNPTPRHLGGWGLLFIAMMLLWAGMTLLTLVLPRPRTLDEAAAARRLALIKLQREKQTARLNSYGWADEQNKIAHIPIERAMSDLADESAATTP